MYLYAHYRCIKEIETAACALRWAPPAWALVPVSL